MTSSHSLLRACRCARWTRHVASASLLLGLALLLSGCDPGTSSGTADDPAVSAPASAPPAQAGSVVIADAQGTPVWTLRIDGSHVEIALASGQRLVGEQRGDKRRYRDAGDGRELFEVKSKPDSLKLRTPDSRLLWKLKLGDSKLKLSDNEENAAPWTLKTGYPDKAKLVGPDDRELGEVRYAEQRSKVKDADGQQRYLIEGSRRSAGYALLLLDRIPEAERAALAAELLARGR